MKRILMAVLVLSCCFSFATVSVAGEQATKEEVIAKCKEAVKLAQDQGLDAAIQQVNDKSGPFVWKDTYVFIVDMDNVSVLAHPIKPKLIGKKLAALKDVNGKMFFTEFVNVAKADGEGWVDYMWPKPGEKKPSPKSTYVFRVPGQSAAMCAGIYQ